MSCSDERPCPRCQERGLRCVDAAPRRHCTLPFCLSSVVSQIRFSALPSLAESHGGRRGRGAPRRRGRSWQCKRAGRQQSAWLLLLLIKLIAFVSFLPPPRHDKNSSPGVRAVCTSMSCHCLFVLLCVLFMPACLSFCLCVCVRVFAHFFAVCLPFFLCVRFLQSVCLSVSP